MTQTYENAMRKAIQAAEEFVGATAPNPPVGAAALDRMGELLLSAAHQRAGTAHAEARLLSEAAERGLLEKIETLVVTLEPCNHHGRTPPCSEAILKHKNIRRVVIGCMDPNPSVSGGGASRLRQAGVEVITGVLEAECKRLIAPFTKWATRKRPYVLIKAAFTPEGSMIPPLGSKTFTSDASLNFAHELRKKSDAIWTGSGTVFNDNPEFTVRRVIDHPEKKRFLVLSDRRRRVPSRWLDRALQNGFEIHFASSFEEGLDYLGKKGVLQVLVEAGPALRDAWLASGLWDESVVIQQGTNSEVDDITVKFRNALEAKGEFDVHRTR
jgi:diaminohydroxyphosphoribosylaminopyrimidine deaminase / 5-amino-6-(5-phosphoribosylamino)uracil reductase